MSLNLIITVALVICTSMVFSEDSVTLTSSDQVTSIDPFVPSTPDTDRNTLAEALRVIDRRKREVTRSHQPYSAYRPLSTSHSRYRYPLYRKRSSYSYQDYYDQDNYPMSDYDYDVDYIEKPSLFRERERGPSRSLISNGHFFDKKAKKSLGASFAPARQSMYWQEKKASRNYPSVTRFFDTLEAIKNRYNRDYYTKNGERKQGLTRTYRPEFSSKQFMIRKKRSIPESPHAALESVKQSFAETKRGNDKETASTPSSKIENNSKVIDKDSRLISLLSNHQPTMKMDRKKRVSQDQLRQEAENDFLTQEYFKTIARSVGNKKKRMAYASFEPPSVAMDKKSYGDTFIDNPSMMNYVQEQLKETEEEIADDAEKQLRSHPPSDNLDNPRATMLLSNSIAKLDALEKMRKALYQLERLQEEDAIRKRAMSLVNGYDNDRLNTEMEKEKRRKSLRNADVEKRKDDIFQQLFKGNKREECPVLDRIILNCIAITEVVGDEAKAFLEPCLRHEICYMCGSGLDVTRHECDALLSSALEAGCSNDLTGAASPTGSSLDCLSAAGDTFNALGDASRYDDKGTCTYDPCVRELLDSR